MVTLIGDVHGKFDQYYNIVKNKEYSIQLGDFGFTKDWLFIINSYKMQKYIYPFKYTFFLRLLLKHDIKNHHLPQNYPQLSVIGAQ